MKRDQLKIVRQKTRYENLFLKYLTSINYYDGQVILLMNKIIDLYGKDEWKAVTLTHELHGHVGIFSIIGAKMGIYAMEMMNCKRRQLQVKSFAGFQPPFSCMNDGLQASIGATVGNNLLKIENVEKSMASADCSIGTKHINLTLKPKKLEELQTSLKNAPGYPELGNKDYWKYVEEISFKYWLEWDRKMIFIVKEELN